MSFIVGCSPLHAGVSKASSSLVPGARICGFPERDHHMSQFHESLQLTGGKAQSSEPGSVQAASNSREGHDLALVLGGGGAAGNAWQIGVIAGLAEGGLDLTVRADLVVGTSAGATTAALVRSNIPPAELLASVLSPSAPPVGRSPERTPSIPMATVFERMRTISAAAISAADLQKAMGAFWIGERCHPRTGSSTAPEQWSPPDCRDPNGRSGR